MALAPPGPRSQFHLMEDMVGRAAVTVAMGPTPLLELVVTEVAVAVLQWKLIHILPTHNMAHPGQQE